MKRPTAFSHRLGLCVLLAIFAGLSWGGVPVRGAPPEAGPSRCLSYLTALLDAPAAHAYRLPDTGQTKCYDDVGNVIICPDPGEPFYGQDAQCNGPQPAFRDNGNGTVTDLNTGLVWQKGDDQNGQGGLSPNYTWQEAVDYCADVDLGDRSDWRLPTRRELMSIVNYQKWDPSIDTHYFPDCRSYGYWSSSTYAGSPAFAWRVHFEDGSVFAYAAGYNYLYVRCVRGGPSDGSSFVDNGNGTVLDTVTGLVWQQADDGVTRDWEYALSYCEGLGLANHRDWRLPNVRELESIVDDSRYNPAIDPVFSWRADYYYWSSSTGAYHPDDAWLVYFYDGYVLALVKDNLNLGVRCVRGGPTGLPIVKIKATRPETPESGATKGRFTVTRTGSTDAALDVYYNVRGTAINGTDYNTLSGSVRIAAGSSSAKITITPKNDTSSEGVETIVLKLKKRTSYQIAPPGRATVTINDDD